MDKQERSNDAFFDKILVKTLIKTYPIKAFLGNYDDSLYIIDQIHEHKNLLNDKEYAEVLKDRELIEKRNNSEKKKLEGDEMLKKDNVNQAEAIYKEIMANFQSNEKVMSNLSMITLNNGQFDVTLNLCTNILKIIKSVKEKISLKKFDSTFEVIGILQLDKDFT